MVLTHFTHIWRDDFSRSLMLNPDNTTLAVAMGQGYTNEQGIALVNVSVAGVILYIVPILLLFLFVQRSFGRGIVASGLKR